MKITEIDVDPECGFALLDPHTIVPRIFTVTATTEPGESPGLEVELGVAVDDYGHAVCGELQVAAAALSEPITGEVLRTIPIRQLIHEAVAAAASKITETLPDGDQVLGPLTPADRESLDKGLGRRPRRGSPITEATLRDVASRYKAAVEAGKPPTQAVARELNIARSTAARWVAAARKRGFLGAAMRGKGGEAT